MDPVIELDGLEVRFGERVILKRAEGLAHRRAPSACWGRTAPGKSTLLNTLLGFHKPAAGTARIFGRDIRTQAARSAQPGRLHARKRCLHRRHERRALRAADGGAGRPAARARPGARSRGLLLRGPGRSALPRPGHLLAGHEAGRQAGAGHRPRSQAAVSGRADQRPRPARARCA